jgi:response regulator RpfG family c-di-GMP phosphodiesterase
VRSALAHAIREDKVEVVTAETVAQALALLATGGVGCLVADDSGVDLASSGLVETLLEREPGGGVLLMVSGDLPEHEVDPRGAIEYLFKPVDLETLCLAVHGRLRRRDALLESHQINAWLSEEVTARTDDLRTERENLRHLSVAALEALVNALEAKDPHLRGHSMRVSDLAARIAEEMSLAPTIVEAVRTAGRLHDLGKIGVSEAVLRKQGPLTNEEFEHIKTHPGIGADILAPLSHLGEVLGLVRHHHERWDGRGYPAGLAGTDIPIGARIIGAVETFDALTTPRPYQTVMTPAQAVVRMRDLLGSVIDPTVHAALVRLVDQLPREARTR